MYFVSIDAGAQVAIILLACGPCVVIVNFWDRFCTLGRAPRTKETLPDFCEWCRVTRHPRVFRGLTGCQRDTPVLRRHTNSIGESHYVGHSIIHFKSIYSHAVKSLIVQIHAL